MEWTKRGKQDGHSLFGSVKAKICWEKVRIDQRGTRKRGKIYWKPDLFRVGDV